ncbi:hypothetical protein IB265_34245 [Ensifer sp. ENS10]|uniref:hypothetical protein n=1 Tax=unclassified Ensifer TaxID=2633371 RepID=UPI00070DAC80|nr:MULTISPECIES: hypothetical protein [unclassified Ensifer]KRD64075.1 hypothetical protein ASE60_30080 [Ensifer sp. Root278]MBD9511815.1 hypothetical protein [Ensifer sp. ENS10]MBV7522253.1 hypothetical protein [Ensifer sp. ENS12]
MNPHQVIAGRRNLTVDAADKQNDVPGMDLAGSDAIAPLHAADTAAAFPVAATLFRALDEAGVRYGIIQDLASLPEAVAGCDDLDVLLDKQDYPMFCSIMAELHGRRGVSLSCYDNVCAGREDWFVADFSCGAYLHLDLHVGIRVGWEFRKRYLAFDHAAVGRWEHVFVGGISIPVVSPEDEVRISIARFAFRLWTLPWKRWVAIRGSRKEQLARLSPAPGEPNSYIIEYKFGRGRSVSCRIRPSEDGILVHSGDLARLRLSLRQRCGFSRASGIADAAVHFVRKASYLALRLAGRVMPGAVPPKRWPWAGGVVVALVAPDGLGKSTQVSLLTRIFRWKFGCAQVYVGTGEGRGWRLRKGLQRLAFYRRRELKAMIRTEGRESRAMGRILSVGLALWGVLIAIERYAVVNRAHRWAMRGMIVISDRWPQKLRHGYLDGPMIPPNLSSAPGVGMLARLEKKLYERMDSCRPHLTLHLVSDYSVSEARKPGEITREGFDARLALMAELRALDNDIRTIDASASAESVKRELFKEIWLSL